MEEIIKQLLEEANQQLDNLKKILPLYNVDDRQFFVGKTRGGILKNQLSDNIADKLAPIKIKDVVVGYRLANTTIYVAKDDDEYEWMLNMRHLSIEPILSKILKFSGLKIIGNSLYFPVYNIDLNHQSEVGQILVTSNFSEMLEVLALDEAELTRPGVTLNDIFNQITKSPYFHLEKFVGKTDEELAKQHEIFVKFSNYLKSNTIAPNSKIKITVDALNRRFPIRNIAKQYKDLTEKAETRYYAEKKFNGSTILSLHPHTPGWKVGLALKNLFLSFSETENYKDGRDAAYQFINANPIEKIMEKVCSLTPLEA